MSLLFINIPLEKAINICTQSICDQDDSAECLNKSEFKELLPLAIVPRVVFYF